MKRPAQKTGRKRAVEMPGLWKARKAKNRLPTLSTSPLEISPTAARFPHSHSPGDEANGKMENQTQVSHFPTATNPIFLSHQKARPAAGLRPSPQSYRVVVVDREK
jgi:hypothetical protein